MNPIDIHLVSWNRPKMTELVVRTLHRNTKPGHFRLHILDNGSDKDTLEMLQGLYDKQLIDSYVNLDKNKGLEFAREYLRENYVFGDYFVCLDNDCLAQPISNELDWLDRLLNLMEKYEDYAAISCRTQVMIGTGNIFETTDDKGEDVTEFPHPGGSFRIMDTRAVHSVGGWKDNKPGRGTEERYICGKLRDAGFKTGFANHIYTLHLFGTRGGEQETDRWGYDKDAKPEETGHSDIWHPALSNGDDPYDVEKFSGKKLTSEYFSHADNYSQKK